MKDKIYLVLAFVGFVIIAFVTVNNYDLKQDEKAFSVASYYTPNEVRSRAESSIDLVNEMTGARRLECPVVIPKKTSEDKVNFTSNLYTGTTMNAYNAKFFFLTKEAIGITADPEKKKDGDVIKDITDFQSSLNASESITDKTLIGEFRLGDVFNIEEGDIVEIIAPFKYTFSNINTNAVDNEIIIVNHKKKCRIDFKHTANWFCAGSPGTSFISSIDESGSVAVEWEDHSSVHKSVIGDTKNSKTKGGSAGDVIGYATADTTVCISVYKDNTWKDISLYNFIHDSKDKPTN